MTKLPEGVEKLCSIMERDDESQYIHDAARLIRAQARVIDAKTAERKAFDALAYYRSMRDIDSGAIAMRALVVRAAEDNLKVAESALSTLIAEIEKNG